MSHKAMPLLGAIEGGGTKFLCAVSRMDPQGQGDEAKAWPPAGPHCRIDTRTPTDTLRQVIDFFRAHPPDALGVAMFGPLDLRPGADFGRMLKTPKAGWSGAPVWAPLCQALGVPVALDTDVNAAAVAEAEWGAAAGADPLLYVTVGTGIGGGVVVHGKPLHGLMHPEMGHMRLARERDAAGVLDTQPSVCPFHPDCLEGLASGPALHRRLGMDPAIAPLDHPGWELEARYLAAGLLNAVMLLSPASIILGGGVMQREGLHARVRRHLTDKCGGYIDRSALGADIDHYLRPPSFAASGLVGAFALAAQAWRQQRAPH